jgi:hypothetical protein
MRQTSRLAAALALLATLGAAACASGGLPEEESSRGATSTRAHPLGALLGADRVIVLPTRYLSLDRGLGWAAALDTATTLAGIDDELRFALAERGVGADWIWPEEARRSSARSAGAVPDVRRLHAEPLLGVRAGDAITVPDPLRSQLRALGALHSARYVLYPLMVSLAPTPAAPAGTGRASLRLALIDVRSASVVWAGEVESGPVTAYGPALAAGVASRVADLVLTRP